MKNIEKLIHKARNNSLVSFDRLRVLDKFAKQALYLEGNFWECGVYKGGTALLFSEAIKVNKQIKLRLFDTFSGMPECHPQKDKHKKGDFIDTSLESVKAFIGDTKQVHYYEGLIPETFKGLEDEKIAFVHIDVDIYQSVMDCCKFIMPRMVKGGIVIFDDYGFESCPGAKEAIDEYFKDKSENPLQLPTNNALVVKL